MTVPDNVQIFGSVLAVLIGLVIDVVGIMISLNTTRHNLSYTNVSPACYAKSDTKRRFGYFANLQRFFKVRTFMNVFYINAP